MRIRRISGLMPARPVRPVELHGPEDLNAAVPAPPPEPPPPDRADWGAHAEQRRVEEDLQETARQAELQQPGTRNPLQLVLAAARKAGLKPTEITRMRAQLTALPRKQLPDELEFLRAAVLRSSKPARSLRMYLSHVGLSSAHPDRLPLPFARTLVRCQIGPPGAKPGKEETENSKPEEATRTLLGMTPIDYKIAVSILDDRNEEETDENRARILRELASRKDSLLNPAIQDHFRNMVGLPSYFLGEVLDIAREMQIRTGKFTTENMNVSSVEEVSPHEYLKEGFFTPEYNLHPGIYGFCSAAMAKRCRLENVATESVRDLVDILSRLGEEILDLAGPDPDLSLEESIQTEFRALAEMEDIQASPALRELMEASEPWLLRFRDLAALVVHLERILSHLATNPE